MIFIFSSSLFVLLAIIYGIIKYLNRNEQNQIYQFIYSLGYYDKECNRMIRNMYLFDALIMFLCVSLIGMIYLYGIGKILQYPIPISSMFIIYAFIFSIIIMFCVPFFVDKIEKK